MDIERRYYKCSLPIKLVQVDGRWQVFEATKSILRHNCPNSTRWKNRSIGKYGNRHRPR